MVQTLHFEVNLELHRPPNVYNLITPSFENYKRDAQKSPYAFERITQYSHHVSESDEKEMNETYSSMHIKTSLSNIAGEVKNQHLSMNTNATND